MERWEPPKSQPGESRKRSPRFPQLPRRDLPEIWLMVGMRLGVALVFITAVLFDALREQMQLVALAVVAALFVVILQSDKLQTQRLRRQTILDLAIVVTIVPVAVLNAFVAAESHDLLPAEQSAYLQTGGALLITVMFVIWLGTALFRNERDLLPALLLPGILALVSVSFVLPDYRNQTVLAMLAVSYFLGAAAIALGSYVDEAMRQYVPLAFFGFTIVAGLALFDPGLQAVFDRDALVQTFTGFMILVGGGVLALAPNPSLGILSLTTGTRSGGRARSHRRREADDPGRQTER